MSEFTYIDDEVNDVYIKKDKDLYAPEWGKRSEGVFSLATRTTKTLPSGVYRITQDSDSRIVFNEMRILTDELISFPDSLMAELQATVELFWESKEEFIKFKQLYKRGILLYGKQGCGKTATLNLMFKTVLEKHDGLVIYIEKPALCLEAIKQLREVEPERPIILLYEDIDSLIDEHKEHGVLALLDGEYQTDNVLHLATTNYLDKIPDRLKNRDGRLDEIIEIFPPNKESRELYINHIFTNIDAKPEASIVEDTEHFTLAHIKELIISVYLLKKDYKTTLERLKAMNTPGKAGFKTA
jgi:SpoVK/Ycf46/Vps4 family AAA+-type ATPase